MTTYKAGIIGLGFIGGADPVSGDALGQKISSLDGTHFVSLNENPRVEVVAGSTRDAGRRERFAERSGARTYSDWQEMLDKEDLDIVSVATYSPVHAEMTVACANRGIRAIYCEKPITTRLPDAERMLAACEKSGSLLAINHNRRFDPNYRRLRDLIAGGGLGEITSVNLQWPSGRLGGVGTHNFDVATMLTSSRIEAVSGTLDQAGKPDCRGPEFQDPGGWGIMRLASGAMITVDAADYATTPYLTVVNGTKGRARAGLFKTEFVLEYLDGTSETWQMPPVRPSGMDVCVGEIVAWLDNGTPFSHPAEEALHTFEAIVGFHASHARNGAWVELPLEGEDRERVVNTA
jgi:predicted dehydrogenase